MDKNHKDQQSVGTATDRKEQDANHSQTNAGIKNNSTTNDNQTSQKGNSDKTGKASMDHENKSHDSDRNKNSKH